MAKRVVLAMVAVSGLLVALLSGCSGAGELPPPAPAGQTASAQAGATGEASSQTVACSSEGAVANCARILDRRGGYVLCAHGTESCGGGQWGECIPEAGQSDWYPAGEPCEPCAQEGSTRACEIEIGEERSVNNCFKGSETCQGGFWGKCQ